MNPKIISIGKTSPQVRAFHARKDIIYFAENFCLGEIKLHPWQKLLLKKLCEKSPT